MAGIYFRLTVLPLVAGGNRHDDDCVSEEIATPTGNASIPAETGELRRTISIPQGVALYLGAVRTSFAGSRREPSRTCFACLVGLRLRSRRSSRSDVRLSRSPHPGRG